MAVLSSIVRAVGTLTGTGVFANAETVVIGGKTYTMQTTLTDVDGNVLIGANLAASLANLKAAIGLEAGAGTTYAASMTVHPHVRVKSQDSTTLVVESKVPGAIGNLIATTETGLNASWGAATLATGAGSVATAIKEIRAQDQVNASILASLDAIDGSSAGEA